MMLNLSLKLGVIVFQYVFGLCRNIFSLSNTTLCYNITLIKVGSLGSLSSRFRAPAALIIKAEIK